MSPFLINGRTAQAARAPSPRLIVARYVPSGLKATALPPASVGKAAAHLAAASHTWAEPSAR